MRSFDVAYGFRLLPTLSNIPPVRANAVIVVVIVVVDITVGRNAKKNATHNLYISIAALFFLQAIAIYFTSRAILLQYSAELSANKFKFIESSI